MTVSSARPDVLGPDPPQVIGSEAGRELADEPDRSPPAVPAPQHGEWVQVLNELTRQLDTGLLYDRDLDGIAEAVLRSSRPSPGAPGIGSGEPPARSCCRVNGDVPSGPTPLSGEVNKKLPRARPATERVRSSSS